ncbi:MAG TPA: tRNA (adenosine(37)-N6)-dimethylallyltransferase MiaA [Flavobacterium sp.]|jgi:tRNA dimethylallyltransferase
MIQVQTKYLIVVVGPTAIGKTSLAIKLAQHFGCEIISADSRQFFKEMCIGTAVPAEDELAAVKHHFIQHKSVFERYTVGDFEKDALAALEQLYYTHDFAVMAGGSGLYIDAVLKGFDEFPDVKPQVREKVMENYETEGMHYLQEELMKLDPDYAGTVDMENPQRMMRAIEVTISSGRPYSSFLTGKENPRSFTPVIIGIDGPRETIYNRINQRVDIMMEKGLLNEAEQLYECKHLNGLQTVGYKELFSYLDGEIPLETAVAEIKKNTRRFAKRQLTWFRRNPDISWFDFETPVAEIAAFIKRKTLP